MKSTEKLRKVKLNSVSQFHRILLFWMMALKVSLEENCKEAHEKKSLRYADLMSKCKDKRWKLWLFQVEVAAKVFFSAIHVEAARRNIKKNMQDSDKKTGRRSRSLKNLKYCHTSYCR